MNARLNAVHLQKNNKQTTSQIMMQSTYNVEQFMVVKVLKTQIHHFYVLRLIAKLQTFWNWDNIQVTHYAINPWKIILLWLFYKL